MRYTCNSVLSRALNPMELKLPGEYGRDCQLSLHMCSPCLPKQEKFMTIKKKKPIFFFIFEAHLESCNYTLSMKCKQKLSVFFLPARWNIDVRVSTTAAILD